MFNKVILNQHTYNNLPTYDENTYYFIDNALEDERKVSYIVSNDIRSSVHTHSGSFIHPRQCYHTSIEFERYLDILPYFKESFMRSGCIIIDTIREAENVKVLYPDFYKWLCLYINAGEFTIIVHPQEPEHSVYK